MKRSIMENITIEMVAMDLKLRFSIWKGADASSKECMIGTL